MTQPVVLSLADSRATPDESHIASVTADQPQAKSHQVHNDCEQLFPVSSEHPIELW